MANDLLEFMNSRLVSSLEFIFRTKQRCFFFFFFIFLNISCDVSYCLQFFFFFFLLANQQKLVLKLLVKNSII